MTPNSKVLVINSSFPELNHFAVGAAQAGRLSLYVRPYINKGRTWEKILSVVLSARNFYDRTFGRRNMLPGIAPEQIREAARLLDFTMYAVGRLPISAGWGRELYFRLVRARGRALAEVGAKVLKDERIVMASYTCAEPVFRKMKSHGGKCILNCPLAHHRFTRTLLLEEAELQPDFADTIVFQNRPRQVVEQIDSEIGLADHILVGSTFVRDTFLAEGVPTEKLEVIPYGADASLYEPNERSLIREDGLKVLFVGQIGQRKGISYLLDGYRQFRGPQTSLTLAGKVLGDGRALAEYSDLFTHTGHVPRLALREIYRQADVFLFPTLVEGMPIVVLEAMASGLPVITTAHGPGDIVRDGVDGFIIPIRDVDAITEKLQFFRDNPDIRAEMGRKARVRALEFTWQRYGERVIDFLDKLG